MDVVYFILQLAIASTIPLAIVAFGALFSERSGVVNIALEGIMLMGAFTGTLVMKAIEPTGMNIQLIALVGLGVGAITGLIYSLLHAFASIHMRSNQIISATALNMFALAFTVFIARTYSVNKSKKIPLEFNYKIPEVPILSDIPVIGDIFFKQAFLSTYIGIAIFIISTIVLYKTRFGLRVRACGENPHAADSLGINIYFIRYMGVMISGALAGMGGVIFVLSFAGAFDGSVFGFGFLSLSVLIFGQWKPLRIILAALFFGFMRVIASAYFAIDFLVALDLPSEIYSMTPYVATLVVLVFVSKKSASPRAAGIPYDPGKR